MGRVFFQHYISREKEQMITFALIEPKKGNIRCSACGLSVWNATNFACDVHFCPHRETTVEITDYLVFKK